LPDRLPDRRIARDPNVYTETLERRDPELLIDEVTAADRIDQRDELYYRILNS